MTEKIERSFVSHLTPRGAKCEVCDVTRIHVVFRVSYSEGLFLSYTTLDELPTYASRLL